MTHSANLSKKLSNQGTGTSIRRSSRKKTFTSSTLYKKKHINDSLVRAKKELSEIINKCLSHASVIYYDDKAVTCTKVEFCRMLSEWSRKTSLDKAMRNIIINAFLSSEQLLGSSGIISCMMFVDKVEVISKKRNVFEEDIRKIIDCWMPSGLSRKIANEIFSMGGCGVEVVLKESEAFGTKIEAVTGTCQYGHIENLFSSKLPEDFSIHDMSYVVAIDGIVENMSQIHSLVEKTSGQNLIIAARGFLPDVANTLLANYEKKLMCIPFVIDEDWCCKNFLDLEKIGVACASSVIGSEISKLKNREKIKVAIARDKIHFDKSLVSTQRKINISFGKDLQSLKGISIDRVRFLLAVIRFTSRSGISTLKYGDHIIYAPASTYSVAERTTASLDKILQNLGAVVTYT